MEETSNFVDYDSDKNNNSIIGVCCGTRHLKNIYYTMVVRHTIQKDLGLELK